MAATANRRLAREHPRDGHKQFGPRGATKHRRAHAPGVPVSSLHLLVPASRVAPPWGGLKAFDGASCHWRFKPARHRNRLLKSSILLKARTDRFAQACGTCSLLARLPPPVTWAWALQDDIRQSVVEP